MNEIIALLGGTLYGLLIGIIPGAGATTGLVAIVIWVCVQYTGGWEDFAIFVKIESIIHRRI
jgi:hypothetical protein